MLTEKQKKFILHLLKQSGYAEPTDWVALLSKKAAHQMIEQLLREKEAARLERIEEKKRYQAQLALPPPEPLAADDPLIPPELVEFKRWAREVYERGEQTILQLIALREERFGKPVA